MPIMSPNVPAEKLRMVRFRRIMSNPIMRPPKSSPSTEAERWETFTDPLDAIDIPRTTQQMRKIARTVWITVRGGI
jgi:hypothetical protein